MRVIFVSVDPDEAAELVESLGGCSGVAGELRETLRESLATGWLSGALQAREPTG